MTEEENKLIDGLLEITNKQAVLLNQVIDRVLALEKEVENLKSEIHSIGAIS